MPYYIVTGGVCSRFLTLAKKEFRAKNSTTRGSLLRMQRESTLEEKNRVGLSESCLGLLERKSQRQKQASWAARTQEASCRGKRRSLGDRFRGLAQDELLLPTATLVAVLVGSLRAQEKESKDTHLIKYGADVGERVGERERESASVHSGSFVLRAFIYFLRQKLQGRVSIEYSSAFRVCFNMLLHHNESIGSGSWFLLIYWYQGRCHQSMSLVLTLAKVMLYLVFQLLRAWC